MATVAVLGAGGVGCALGERLIHAGVDLRFGVRNPEAETRTLAGSLAEAPLLAPAEAARDAGIVFLAVPASAATAAVESIGSLHGKILVDCTNPLRWDGGPIWDPPAEGSVTRALAAAFPGVAIVKGFNHFGLEIQRNPELVSGPADAFFAGDDAEAKATVMDLAGRMGFQPRDAGPLRNAAVLENLAVLWIHLAMNGGEGRTFSFRVEPQR